MTRDQTVRRVIKPAVFAAALGPLAWLGWLAVSDGLGANPIEAIVRFLGDWGLRFLLIALAVTPIREITGWSPLARLRRMLGLFAFFYVALHLMAYVGLDLFFDLRALWADVLKRTYITVGMAAFLLLVPLAVTSTRGWTRRLGGRRWQALHRAVYAIGVLGVVHYTMMVKADHRLPLAHAAVLALLLAWRLFARWRRRRQPAAPPRPAVV